MYSGLNALKKRIYFFDEVGDKEMIGVKGLALSHLHKLQLPTPPGFVITIQTCSEHYWQQNKQSLNSFLIEDCEDAVFMIERMTDTWFGLEKRRRSSYSQTPHSTSDEYAGKPPLLLAIRSTATVRSPGQMRSILNLGMNQRVVDRLVGSDPGMRYWALDTYRRFLQDFGTTVYGVSNKTYEDILNGYRSRGNTAVNAELSEDDLENIVHEFQSLADIPDDPWDQLFTAIKSVYTVWSSPASIQHRDQNRIDVLGVAIVVQAMVFGNKNVRSGSGLCFTRQPTTGEPVITGRFVECGQGSQSKAGSEEENIENMKHRHAAVYGQLVAMAPELEREHKDMQEIEFTFEDGKLYILETRVARRSLPAARRVLVDLVEGGMLSREEALMRIQTAPLKDFPTRMLDQLHSFPEKIGTVARNYQVGEGTLTVVDDEGIGVTGKLVFDAAGAEECRRNHEMSILCTNTIDDGFQSADGVMVFPGCDNKEAVRYLQSISKTAVVGMKDLQLDAQRELITCEHGTPMYRKGDEVTLCALTCKLYNEDLLHISAAVDASFGKLLRWAASSKRMLVKAAVRSLADVRSSSRLQVDGVVILATECFLRQSPMHKEISLARCSNATQMRIIKLPTHFDLMPVFRVMEGKIVTIRLCDNPNATTINLKNRRREVYRIPSSEVTPLQYILDAIAEAREEGIYVKPCVLVPEHMSGELAHIAKQIAASNVKLHQERRLFGCIVGLLVESAMGCRAVHKLLVGAGAQGVDCVAYDTDKINADFFHLAAEGTTLADKAGGRSERAARRSTSGSSTTSSASDNISSSSSTAGSEETQAEKKYALQQRSLFDVLQKNPNCDNRPQSVGELLQKSMENCIRVSPNIETVVCGEHCADVNSIRFFDWLDVHCIVCPPEKIPVATIAAAQTNLRKTTRMRHT